ncbi:MAG: hypothetical protein HY547_04770 [Elusimicrobia bacterium]|nr:hypothetical protein [Elusimicrobiota bacterium]
MIKFWMETGKVVVVLPLLAGAAFGDGIDAIVSRSDEVGYRIEAVRLRSASETDLKVISEALDELGRNAGCLQNSGNQAAWLQDGDCAMAGKSIRTIEERLRTIESLGGAASRGANQEKDAPGKTTEGPEAIIPDSGVGQPKADAAAASKTFDRAGASGGSPSDPAVNVAALSEGISSGGVAAKVSSSGSSSKADRKLYRGDGTPKAGSKGNEGTGARMAGESLVKTSQVQPPRSPSSPPRRTPKTINPAEGRLSSDELAIAQSGEAARYSPVKAGVYDVQGDGFFSKVGLRVGFLRTDNAEQPVLAAAIYASEKDKGQGANLHWIGVLPLSDAFNDRILRFQTKVNSSKGEALQFDSRVVTQRMQDNSNPSRQVMVKVEDRRFSTLQAGVDVMGVDLAQAQNKDQLLVMIGNGLKAFQPYSKLAPTRDLQSKSGQAWEALEKLGGKADHEGADFTGIISSKKYQDALKKIWEVHKAIKAYYEVEGVAQLGKFLEGTQMTFAFSVADIWKAATDSLSDNDVYVIGGKNYWMQDFPVFRGDLTAPKLLAASVPNDERKVTPSPIELRGTPFINAKDTKQLRILAFFEKPNEGGFPKIVEVLPITSNTGEIVGAKDGTITVKLGKGAQAPEITIRNAGIGVGSNYRWEIEDKSGVGGGAGGTPDHGPAPGAGAGKLNVLYFEIVPNSVQKGQEATLKWSVEGAGVNVMINKTKNEQKGEYSWKPNKTQTFKLEASDAAGAVQKREAHIEVRPSSQKKKEGVGSNKRDPAPPAKPAESAAPEPPPTPAPPQEPGSSAEKSDAATSSLWAKDQRSVTKYNSPKGACTKGIFQAPGNPNDFLGHPSAPHKHRYCCVALDAAGQCAQITGSVEVAKQ